MQIFKNFCEHNLVVLVKKCNTDLKIQPIYNFKSMIDYNNKTFRSISNSKNGEVSSLTKFHYRQNDKIVTAVYSGGDIISGHLIAIADVNGKLEMRYHHVNINNELMTGTCISTPEILKTGKIRLHEIWEWTNGDKSKGESVIEEM